MTDTPIKTEPPSPETQFLREQYYAAKTKQSDLMDAWARDLLKLELAIPGIYAAVLKFVEGSSAKAPDSPLLFGVFGCWGVSLLITVVAIVPRAWKVDVAKVKAIPRIRSGIQAAISIPLTCSPKLSAPCPIASAARRTPSAKVSPNPSIVLSTILPVKPSVTITSVVPLDISWPSMLPIKFKFLFLRR